MGADVTGMLDVARQAVTAACTVCRAVSMDLEGVDLTKKDASPVTVADFASQAVVIHHLRGRLGEVPIVAEEDSEALRAPDNAALLDRVVAAARRVWPEADADQVLAAIDGGGDRGEGDAFWTLDPIDGTKGFLRRGQYAISLARVEAGRPTLGLLGCPNLSLDFARPFADADPHGVLLCAVPGAGVSVVPADDPGARPRTLDPLPRDATEIRCVESVEARHSKAADVGRILERAGLPSSRLQADSQAKYAVVARGQANLMLRVPTDPARKELIWDHAAGAAVATEAGAIVSDMAGRPLDFTHGARLAGNYGVVCAHGGVHARIIEAIAALDLVPEPPA